RELSELSELPQPDARCFRRGLEQFAGALNQQLAWDRLLFKPPFHTTLGAKSIDMQSHAASGHQHRTRNVAGLPFHPLDITARGHNFPAQAFVALVALTVAVDCMPVHVAILMWQRSALAVLAPMLERQLPRDAHVRFLARKKFRDAV